MLSLAYLIHGVILCIIFEYSGDLQEFVKLYKSREFLDILAQSMLLKSTYHIQTQLNSNSRENIVSSSIKNIGHINRVDTRFFLFKEKVQELNLF